MSVIPKTQGSLKRENADSSSFGYISATFSGF